MGDVHFEQRVSISVDFNMGVHPFQNEAYS